MRSRFSYFLAFAIILGSCSTHINKLPLQQIDNLLVNENNKAINKIVFLTFKITLVDSVKDRYELKLINSILAEGTLKKDIFSDRLVVEPNYLYFRVLRGDEKEQANYERIVNPLATVYEFPDEKSGLAKKLITKNTGEFVIRFQFDQGSKFIEIYKSTSDSLTLKKIYHATL